MSLIFRYFLAPTLPVNTLVFGACLLTLLECFPGAVHARIKTIIAAATATISIGFTLWLTHIWTGELVTENLSQIGSWLPEFTRSYRLDDLSLNLFLSIGIFLLMGVVLFNEQFKKSSVFGETLILLLFVASGMMLLVSANSLVMVFLALELLSLPTYVLVGIRRSDKLSCEAALKYFLFGSFASVLLVLGSALIYAQFSTMNLGEIAMAAPALFEPGSTPPVLAMAGVALFIISIGFKVGLVPFHMWVPDAYHGAPSAVTGFMGSAIKLAAFGVCMRVFWGPFISLAQLWTPYLGAMAVITMFVGNLAGLMQDNLKRLFAYSSVSHAGFLMLGIISLSQGKGNISTLNYYLLVYGLMYLGLFALITLLEQQTKNTNIYQLSGLGFRQPVLGLCFAIFVLSSAGIPPTSGFFAKYFIFLDAMRSGETTLSILGLISSAIGIYYYLRVLVYLYMKEPREELRLSPSNPWLTASMTISAFLLFYLSVFPHGLEVGHLVSFTSR